MTKLLWQLYDQQGRPIHDGGAAKIKTVMEGTLHGSAHVWIWRHVEHDIEVLAQKRANTKINWPGLLDKSAGGHITYGDEPIETAIHKAQSELGLTVKPSQLQLAGVCHWKAPVDGTGLVENDFQWIYLLELAEPVIRIPNTEVDSVLWEPLAILKSEAWQGPAKRHVPYGQLYYMMLEDAIKRADYLKSFHLR